MYTKSLTPLNTLSRPCTSKLEWPKSSVVSTVQAPFRDSAIHSLSPVEKACEPPGGSSSTRRLE